VISIKNYGFLNPFLVDKKQVNRSKMMEKIKGVSGLFRRVGPVFDRAITATR